MMFLLFLLFSCAITVLSEEVVKKQIPIFGPTFYMIIHDELGRPFQRFIPTPEHMYKGVIENPTLVVYKKKPEEKYSFDYAPEGIAKLLKEPKAKPLHDYIIENKDIYAVVYPKAAFPLQYFHDSGEKPIVVPEHTSTLDNLLIDPLFLVLIKKDDFPQLNTASKLGAIADLEVDGHTVRMSRASETHPGHTIAHQPYYYVFPSTSSPSYAFAPPIIGTAIPALPPAKIPGNVGPLFF